MCRAHGIPHQRVTAVEDLGAALRSAWGCNRHSGGCLVLLLQLYGFGLQLAVQLALFASACTPLTRWLHGNILGVEQCGVRPLLPPWLQ